MTAVRIFWLAVLALSVAAFRTSNSSVPPVSRTGAPFDAGSCRSCHASGTPAPTVLLLANSDTVDGQFTYQPGGPALNMELIMTHPTAQVGGYELTVATLPPGNDAAPANAFSASSGSTILSGVGGRRYLAHSGAKSFVSNEVRWSFTWTPPATDIGTLRWYIAANAANGDGSTSGDAVNAVTFDMPAATTASLPQAKALPLAQYDPVQKQMRLAPSVWKTEIFTGDGRLVRQVHGSSAHDISDLHGVYLIRV